MTYIDNCAGNQLAASRRESMAKSLMLLMTAFSPVASFSKL
jgi:hypothetical protein